MSRHAGVYAASYNRSHIVCFVLAAAFSITLFATLGTSKSYAQQASTGDQPSELEKLLTVESALLGVGNNSSLYYTDLKTNDTVALSPERSWIPASTIKAYVMLEAFRQRRLGQLKFDQVVTIAPENVVPTELETDEFPTLTEGVKVTIQQLLGAMITQSDNTAYNTLLDVLDRRNINNTLREYGITETIVGEKLNLDNDQFAKDLRVPGRLPNTTTAKDFATFFHILTSHQVADAEEMLDIFRRQKINSMIPALLPENTIVAHKTGDWAPIYHDGGVIYKPDDPFILSVFTNGNRVRVISKLAQVAYYQDRQYIGKATTTSQPIGSTIKHDQHKRYLALNAIIPQQVLGTSDERASKLTAQDLGITASDLAVDSQDTSKIRTTKVAPGSFFYLFKRGAEAVLVPLTYPRKADQELVYAKHRLAEAKVLLAHGDLAKTNRLLTESEKNLQQAAQTSTDKWKQARFVEIKQLTDLHYATLAQSAEQIPSKDKGAFVDIVYNFYKKNTAEVAPRISQDLLTDPIKRQPIIGVVQKLDKGSATIELLDGSTKTLLEDDLTPMRNFHQDNANTGEPLQVGKEIAVIGQVTDSGSVIPEFILNDVPKELPHRNAGVVTAIDPAHKTIQIQTTNGQVETVKISDSTVLRARDTSVSLEGIIVGSEVSIYAEQPAAAAPVSQGPTNATKAAEPRRATSSGTAATLAPLLQTVFPSFGSPKPYSSSGPTNNVTQQSQSLGQPVDATAVTITTNSAGKDQVIVRSTPTPTPAAATPKPSTQPMRTVAPQSTATKPTSTAKPIETSKSSSGSGSH